MNYTIQNKNLDKNCVFILQHSELEKRLDPFYYVDRIVIKNAQKLSSLVNIKGGKRIPKGLTYSFENTDYKYLRVDNIKEYGEIEWQNLKSISKEIYKFLERYKISKDDIIISIAGTVGKIATIEREIDNVILTENCAKLIIKDKTKILPKYLQILLELSTSKKQIQSGFIQTTIPKLGLDKIEEIKIPEIPTVEKQKEIITIYETAFANKKQCETEANNLLASIDDYLLNELGITLPDENIVNDNVSSYGFNLNNQNSVVQKGRLFLTKFSEIGDGRFDPRYYQKFFLAFYKSIESKYTTKKLKEITEYIGSGTTPTAGGDAYTNKISGIPFIRITNIKNDTIDLTDVLYIKREIHEKVLKNTQLKTGDLLLSMAGTIGLSVVVPDIIKEGNINQALARIVINEQYHNVYIKEVLNSIIGKIQTDRLSRPAVQANINFGEIGSLQIPLPPLDKQQEIANHIQTIRNEANKLKTEANNILETAKREVEQMILGK